MVFAPEETPRLYPRADAPNQSEIPDVFHPDYEPFPLLRGASPRRVILRPGDLLFVLAGAWQTTSLREVSVSVTWNCADRSNWGDFVSDTAAHMGAAASTPGWRRRSRPTRALGAVWRLRPGVE